jgi:hypothetical protein
MIQDLIEGIACYCNTNNQYKARDKYITNFNNIRSNYIKSLDEVDKTIDKYKSIKRDHIKGGFYDNSELDSGIYGSYIPTWKEYKNRNKL